MWGGCVNLDVLERMKSRMPGRVIIPTRHDRHLLIFTVFATLHADQYFVLPTVL